MPLQVAEELWPLFENILEFQIEHKRIERAYLDFPAQFKSGNGRYPTWAEIEAEFPVIGAYVASVRASAGEQPLALAA